MKENRFGCIGKTDHDFDKPIRKGRALYLCSKCGKDITLLLVLLEEVKVKS